MRPLLYIFVVLLWLWGCGEPEARRPLNVKTTTSFDTSVERNRKLMARETEIIKNIIQNDTLNTWYTSSEGFWYCYNTRDSVGSYVPRKDDVALINYTIKTLNNDIIYTKEEIGNVNVKIDREIIFPGLNTGLKLMKKGETVTFLLPSYLAYGYHGDNNKIGINTPLMSTVSLIDIITK